MERELRRFPNGPCEHQQRCDGHIGARESAGCSGLLDLGESKVPESPPDIENAKEQTEVAESRGDKRLLGRFERRRTLVYFVLRLRLSRPPVIPEPDEQE